MNKQEQHIDRLILAAERVGQKSERNEIVKLIQTRINELTAERPINWYAVQELNNLADNILGRHKKATASPN